MFSVMLCMYTCPELSSTIKAARVVCINHYLCQRVVDIADKVGLEVGLDAPDAPAGVPCDKAALIAKLRGTMAWAYMEQHRTLDQAGMFLTDAEVLSFCRSVNLYNVSLQNLISIDRKHIWRARPKNHGMDHLCITLILNSRLNPKKSSCLLEEDFLGKMKRIGRGIRGGNCISVATRILDRYILALSLRWAK
jgi:hypothetical protein